ncbi:MAG: carbohydrate kinase family protein [Christensenella sp.]|uniref:carbohydrate kinase family protein n=1 Tax=Christensenella sp. TaxID=1935934 RepID=UPI002B213C1A|nr:carbohydrate kinase family protein [Christensenella sp.]MEA5001933.1 carbohydrate kinase family protein [Christensenella sp.]
MKKVDVVSIGAINCDIIAFVSKFPEAEQKINSTELVEPKASGVALDCLTMINNLGLSCGHIGKMGEDEYAACAQRDMKESGIDFSYSSVVKGARSSLAWVMVNKKDGERCHIMHPMCGEGMIGSEDIRAANEYIKGAKAVHMEMLQMPMGPLYEAAELCRENGVVTSMDIDIAPRFLYEYKYADPALLKKTFACVDIIKLCKDAVQDLTEETDLLKAASDIAQKYDNKVLIVTDGDKGCVVAWREGDMVRSALVSGFTDTPVVDTTGSGDAFAGGFLYGYLNGYPIEKAAQLGNACGYLKALNIGARNMPKRETVEAFLRKKGWDSL